MTPDPSSTTVTRPTSARAAARVAVAGATGFAGQELVRILAAHQGVTLTTAMSSASNSTPRPMPALARVWDGPVVPLDLDQLVSDAEVVFLALPEAASAECAPALIAKGVRVIDLSGAFRIGDATLRHRWYPATGNVPEGVVYGLSELNAEAIKSAALVSNPGCYPTAALLALEPLDSAGLIDGPVVIDAKSGVSGAGKAPSERTHFSEVHGSVSTYGVFSHRHAAEIEQGLASEVTFIPHLVPLDRGILETIYVPLAPGTTESMVAETLGNAYKDAAFIRLTGEALPVIRQVAYTNFCDIGWKLDPVRPRLLMVSVIDNLLKGAASQAVQNLNLMLGLDERTGLF